MNTSEFLLLDMNKFSMGPFLCSPNFQCDEIRGFGVVSSLKLQSRFDNMLAFGILLGDASWAFATF